LHCYIYVLKLILLEANINVKRRLYLSCSYSETGIIIMLKSVASIRLAKFENPSVGVTVNCKVCRSGIVLYYM
jgi:hypothetical protein